MIGELTSCTVTTASKVPSLRNDKRAEWKKCTALYVRVGFSFFGFREIGRGIVLRSFEVWSGCFVVLLKFLEWVFAGSSRNHSGFVDTYGTICRQCRRQTAGMQGKTSCLTCFQLDSKLQSCQEWLLPTAGRAHDLQWYRCWRWMCEGPLTGHVRLLSFSATIVSGDSYVPLNCPIIQKLIWLWDV